eukprot:448142_1
MSSPWKCNVCTYSNIVTSSMCAMCGLPKDSCATEIDHSMLPVNRSVIETHNIYGNDSNWMCRPCTFSNHAWTDRCEVCSAKRRRIPNHTLTNGKVYQIQISNVRSSNNFAVYGYIRNIQTLLKNKIIPLNINELCYEYFVNDTWDSIIQIISIRVSSYQQFQVFLELKKIAENLLIENDATYRLLYLQNEVLQDKILKHDATINILYSLGFEVDTVTNDKLICKQINIKSVEECISCLEHKLNELYTLKQ